MYDYENNTKYEYKAKDALKILEKRSEDPHTQVACIITDKDDYLVSIEVIVYLGIEKVIIWKLSTLM